mgnify:CR=1 FL=1
MCIRDSNKSQYRKFIKDVTEGTIERIEYIEDYVIKNLKDDFDLSFGNGGDQKNNIIPEKEICERLSINLVDNLGEKIQSSSWLLKKQ